MREVFATVATWLEEGRTFAIATLAELREAKTAPLGTSVAVDANGNIAGNIGAGCYESEIIETAMQTLRDGTVRRLDVNLDSDDELAGGTACGAQMRLVVWRPEPAFLADARAIVAGERPVTLAVDGFVHTWAPKDVLLLVGATSLAAALATMGRRMDLRVIVIDPRSAFATSERIPDADALVREWPDDYLPRALDARTLLVVLSHDPKFDLPALRAALRSNAPYIGLLGSRRAQAARRAALRAEGFSDGELARIRGPVGLDIGGATAGETAISILAEIVAQRSGRSGTPLHVEQGAIH
jgi:xanthine dehydrogenase accessory factor